MGRRKPKQKKPGWLDRRFDRRQFWTNVASMLFFAFVAWVTGQLRTSIWPEHSPRTVYRDVPETVTLRESVRVATATATNVNTNALPVPRTIEK